MLVRHEIATPAQSLALGDHGARQVHDLVPIEAGLPRRYEKCRNLHLGIAPLGDIAGNRHELLGVEALAVDLAAYGVHGCRRLGVAHPYGRACLDAQAGKGFFRQAELVRCHDRLVVDDVEHGEYAFAVGGNLDLGQCLEALGAVDLALPVQICHVLAVSVDGHGPQPQRTLVGAFRMSLH